MLRVHARVTYSNQVYVLIIYPLTGQAIKTTTKGKLWQNIYLYRVSRHSSRDILFT